MQSQELSEQGLEQACLVLLKHQSGSIDSTPASQNYHTLHVALLAHNNLTASPECASCWWVAPHRVETRKG